MKLIITEHYEVEKITCGEVLDIFESNKAYRLNNFFWFDSHGEKLMDFNRSMDWIYSQRRNKKIYLCQYIDDKSGIKLTA